MKKVRMHEGRIWNTLIYDFRKKQLMIQYFKVAQGRFWFFPRYDMEYNGKKIPVFSWLCFQFGRMTIGKLKKTTSGTIKDDDTDQNYKILLRKDIHQLLSL